jgi:lipopolysaccharide/colanic/teichoic acid biosynthesis glycosyltransferase
VLYPMKIRMDLEYLDEWTLARDIAYLAVTVLPRLDRWLRVIPALELASDRGEASAPAIHD